MFITLLTVGSIKSPWIRQGCEEFEKRLSHDLRLTVTELPPSKKSDPILQMNEETDKMLSALKKIDGQKWLLDKGGERLDTLRFSGEISALKDRGERLTLVIGGAFGFTGEVRKMCTRSITLSAMTLTHEMARLFLEEQLYRCISLQKNTGYHHE